MSYKVIYKYFLFIDFHVSIINNSVLSEKKIINNIKTREIIENVEPSVDYEIDECGWYAKDLVTLEGEDLESFNKLYGMLDDIEDVTDVYHNVNLD